MPCGKRSSTKEEKGRIYFLRAASLITERTDW